MSKLDDGQIARFWSKVKKGSHPDDCWIWKAAKANGYGKFRVDNGRVVMAHRLSYALHYGSEPGELFVCHRCDSPSCINPAHLFLGTQGDNIQDMISKGRFRHAVGEKIGHSKLTSEQVKQIRSAYKTGHYSYRQLAETYGVSHTQIASIVSCKKWKHIA